jgi:hypothetical protein
LENLVVILEGKEFGSFAMLSVIWNISVKVLYMGVPISEWSETACSILSIQHNHSTVAWRIQRHADRRIRIQIKGKGEAVQHVFISAGVPTIVTHLVSDQWHTVFLTDGISAKIHTGLHIYLSHRCFIFCFLASKATAWLCWGITSRCSTKERPCYPTESKQTSPHHIWGHSAAVQIRKELTIPSL